MWTVSSLPVLSPLTAANYTKALSASVKSIYLVCGGGLLTQSSRTE